MMGEVLLMGAVAYDPKVVTIWDGFRRWFDGQGLAFDYILYSNYERLAEDLLAGRIHAAWNSPLAWVRARRLGEAEGAPVRAVAMRDTDRDLTSVVVVKADSTIGSIDDLKGSGFVVGTGAVDSPQATLLPVDHLRVGGITPGVDVHVRRFDVGVGLHGDHVGGERDAARALVAGEVDAACMIDANHLLFAREGTIPSGATRVLTQTLPFDHCNMTVGADAPVAHVERFTDLLLAMEYGDPAVRPLLDLEGLTRWLPGRTDGYAALERAVDHTGFYDGKGAVTADDYRP
jgi:ABC-type phosphate/phosphonate transport system substrate-binding protein